ncbi:MAG: methyltransferase domain-containing protein [Verrucomicrobia bacterium]|nr:methyltransferase domain-containing protein [Verrucomicrobiota bacterium]MBU4428261.1 methyltransferase domain-containing protein [Verrucomicrobiota bacterium]MCG2679560.1 class I SAM-dependent methyltransferase [Kiritimatiellia bacterium]
MTALCPLCGSARHEQIYHQKALPLVSNTVYGTASEAIACAKEPVILHLCRQCGLVFNPSFDSSKIAYDTHYDNRRDSSPRYRRYLDELTTTLKNAYGLTRKNVLEVGCGQGDFLRLFTQVSESSGAGYDPAYQGPEQFGATSFVRAPFVPGRQTTPYNTLILRHVLEHIEQPGLFVQAALDSLVTADDVSVVVEVPCFAWILDAGAYWDIAYEHCNYFTRESLSFLFDQAGIEVMDVQNVFEGQYLLAVGKARQRSRLPHAFCQRPVPQKEFEHALCPKLRTFEQKRASITHQLGQFDQFTIWGVAGKGVTFVNLLDQDQLDKIPFLIDMNPNKQRKYCPGTDKLIVPPSVLAGETQVRVILLMNPIYYDEITEQTNTFGNTYHLLVP